MRVAINNPVTSDAASAAFPSATAPSRASAKLEMSEHRKAASVSELLDLIAERPGREVSVGDLLDTFGDRAFGALMFVFAAPLVLPMPPGVSALLGAPLIFITFQWMMGRKTLWLPKVMLSRTMSMADFRALTVKLKPHLGRLERRLRPRRFPPHPLRGCPERRLPQPYWRARPLPRLRRPPAPGRPAPLPGGD